MNHSTPHFNAPIIVDGREAVIIAIDAQTIAFRFERDESNQRWNLPRNEQNTAWSMKKDYAEMSKTFVNNIMNSPYMGN